MRRLEFHSKNGERHIIEEFESFREFTRELDRRPHLRVQDDNTREEMEGDSWYGVKSYEKAKDLLLKGDATHLERVKESMKKNLTTQESKKAGFKNDVVGFQPIVPNAILGLPNSMIRDVKQIKKSKIVSIMIDIGVASSVSKEDVLEFGIRLMNKIINIEKQGYRVRLEYLKVFNDGKEHYSLKVRLKNENQPMDIKRLLFAITNIAMQRVFTFEWLEKLKGAKRLPGYGRSLSVIEITRRNEIIKDIAKEKNQYIVIYGDNLDEKFRGLK